MNYIVFDLEWNQCPSGKEKENKKIPFEIIEIGAVKLDNKKEEIGRFHEIIKPMVYRSFHFKTQEILKMEMKDLENARSFSDVFISFMEWCGKDPVFCTWGCSDLTELQRNMSYYQITNFFPYPLIYMDIQKIFSIVYEDRKVVRNLEFAVNFLDVVKTEDFHQALSDAYYTSRIMGYLSDEAILKNYSIDYYHHPLSRKEEIYAVFENYSKFVSKEFASKNDALHDRRVASTKCYLCGKSAHKKIRWFSNGSKYYCLAYCERHGYLRGKIRIKKGNGEKFFCIKTLRLVEEEEALTIKSKQEQLRQKKQLRRNSQKNKI